MTCGILVPQTGIEPRSLGVRAQSPNCWTTREFSKATSLQLNLKKEVGGGGGRQKLRHEQKILNLQVIKLNEVKIFLFSNSKAEKEILLNYLSRTSLGSTVIQN